MATLKVGHLNHKLLDLIVYISARSENDPGFGVTKLNKLLFYSDFIAVREFGQPITGHPYIKMQYGPVPKNMVSHLEELRGQGRLVIRDVSSFGYPQKRPINLKEPNLSAFSAKEIDLVNRVLGDFGAENASSISKKSHCFHGWKYAKEREAIPYGTALVQPATISAKVQARAEKLEASL